MPSAERMVLAYQRQLDADRGRGMASLAAEARARAAIKALADYIRYLRTG